LYPTELSWFLYLPKIHSNIIFTSTSRPSKWSFLFRFSNQNTIFTSHLYKARHTLANLLLFLALYKECFYIHRQQYELWKVLSNVLFIQRSTICTVSWLSF
jgi:hypothetical protein